MQVGNAKYHAIVFCMNMTKFKFVSNVEKRNINLIFFWSYIVIPNSSQFTIVYDNAL